MYPDCGGDYMDMCIKIHRLYTHRKVQFSAY